VSSPLAINLAGISLRNPILLAAGTCGTLDEFSDVLDLSRVGGLITKSITRLPREGNPTPRIVETRHGGMLNAIGLANPGIDEFEKTYLPRAAEMDCPVIASVAGFSVEDYVEVASRLDRTSSPLAAIELNISCPNVKVGCEFGGSPEAAQELIAAVRKAVSRRSLIVQLSPWPQGLPDIARAAIDAGAAALTISNTMPAMAIDPSTRRPRLANITGGLSGPAIHPVAVKLVHDVYTKVAKPANIPIIAAGGVLRWEDAAEFILAGATAVQMGTALFVDPLSPLRVIKGLARWVENQRVHSIFDLIGALRTE